MKLNDWLTLVISLSSLAIVVWTTFFGKPKLKAVLNPIILTTIPEYNKDQLWMNILLDDLLSSRISEQAKALMSLDANIQNAVASKDRNTLFHAIVQLGNQRAKQGLPIIIYNPSSEDIQKRFSDADFSFHIYVPLHVSNIGKKAGDIVTLMLKIQSVTDKRKLWYYGCFTEANTEKFDSISRIEKSAEIFGKEFSGLIIGSGESVKLAPLFTQNSSFKNKRRIINGLAPDEYELQVIGYNTQNKKCLASNKLKMEITSDTLVDIFRGITIHYNQLLTGHIDLDMESSRVK